MVAFMLYDAGVKTFNNAINRIAVGVESGISDTMIAWHLAAQPWHRQAPFPSEHFIIAKRCNDRIDQYRHGNRLGIRIALAFRKSKDNDL